MYVPYDILMNCHGCFPYDCHMRAGDRHQQYPVISLRYKVGKIMDQKCSRQPLTDTIEEDCLYNGQHVSVAPVGQGGGHLA